MKILYKNWIDGYKYYGKYVNEKTINYVSKYMTKKDIPIQEEYTYMDYFTQEKDRPNGN